MLSQSDGTNPGSIHYADINASYDIDSLNLLSASFGGYFYKLNVQGDSRTSLSNSSNDILYRFNNHYWMPGYSHHSWNGRLDYEHKTRRKGERLMSFESCMFSATCRRMQKKIPSTSLSMSRD